MQTFNGLLLNDPYLFIEAGLARPLLGISLLAVSWSLHCTWCGNHQNALKWKMLDTWDFSVFFFLGPLPQIAQSVSFDWAHRYSQPWRNCNYVYVAHSRWLISSIGWMNASIRFISSSPCLNTLRIPLQWYAAKHTNPNQGPHFSLFAGFCGGNNPTLIHFRLPAWRHWTQRSDGHPYGIVLPDRKQKM